MAMGKRHRRGSAPSDESNSFEVRSPLGIVDALIALGDRRLVTYEQVCEAFGRDKGDAVPPIRYTKETLGKCAVLNRSSRAGWRMVYALPLSFREQRDITGVDCQNLPYFDDTDGNDWWLDSMEDEWAKSQPEAGYYLIDFRGRFNRTSWNEQNERIAKMGGQFERADERVFSQALVSIFKTHKEQLCLGTRHWGRIADTFGYRVSVGFSTLGGLRIDGNHPFYSDDDRFVCISRKWDF